MLGVLCGLWKVDLRKGCISNTFTTGIMPCYTGLVPFWLQAYAALLIKCDCFTIN